MEKLRISLLQQSIVEDNPEANLSKLEKKLITLKGQTDIAIVPELFTTGFALKNLNLAEDSFHGNTINKLKQWAFDYGIALSGSFLVKDKNAYFNRAFFVTPNSETFFYDKRHLFRMGRESEVLTAGNDPELFSYKGWDIRLLICYDLRFPVWSRNITPYYDLLIYVANWPTVRQKVWETLLSARAIENQSYVIGVNRIGQDSNQLDHHGFSCVYSPKGDLLCAAPINKEAILQVEIDLNEVTRLRNKFPVWKDADKFELL